MVSFFNIAEPTLRGKTLPLPPHLIRKKMPTATMETPDRNPDDKTCPNAPYRGPTRGDINQVSTMNLDETEPEIIDLTGPSFESPLRTQSTSVVDHSLCLSPCSVVELIDIDKGVLDIAVTMDGVTIFRSDILND